MERDNGHTDQLVEHHQKEVESEQLSQLALPISWVKRTFGPLTKGGVRGNIFLLIITTIGSSFFYLPYAARQIGLVFTLILLVTAALLSFFSSLILIKAFEKTKAPTYNDGVKQLVGPVAGFFTNFVILIHTIGQVSSTWIFSYRFLTSGLQQLFGWKDDNAILVNFKYGFVPLGFCLIFLITLLGSAEKLKKVSLAGIAMIIYILIVFVVETPEYYGHYKDEIHVETFKLSWYTFKTWGFCNYMFLNQYAIMPICSGMHKFKPRRAIKIVLRSTVVIVLIYILILFCGYFSLPTNSDVQIFLLRPPLDKDHDSFIMYGKIIFGCTLFVGVLVKAHFMLMYFEQIIGLFWQTFIEKKDSKVENEQQSTPTETGSNLLRNIRRVIFLGTLSLAVFFGINFLDKILGMVGSFVGVFEIIVIPALVMLALNRLENGKLMGFAGTSAFLFLCVFFTVFGFSAVAYNVITS